jgi:hypothetical protein
MDSLLCIVSLVCIPMAYQMRVTFAVPASTVVICLHFVEYAI